MEIIERKIKNKILKLMDSFRVVQIIGPRQSGKTVLAKTIAKQTDTQYVSFDEPNIRDLANNNPELFFTKYQPPLIIDEVQFVPEIISYIKMIVDENNRSGDFLLTGSVDFLRFSKITESLAGRTVIQHLYPFSAGELRQRNFNLIDSLFDGSIINHCKDTLVTYEEMADLLVTGFFPEAIKLNNFSTLNQWFESYIFSRILKDFQNLADKKLHKLAIIPKLLQLLANQTASIIRKNKLSKDLHITYQTTTDYLYFLQTLFIIDFIQPYFINVGKQAIRSPKMYFIDTGLVSYLLKLTPQTVMQKHDQYFGQLLENFVFNELKKEISYSQNIYKLYYYRDNKQNEVDFIIEAYGGDLVCIEVKTKSRITSKDLSGLRVFHQRYKDKIRGLYVFYGGRTFSATKLNEQTVLLVPVGSIM